MTRSGHRAPPVLAPAAMPEEPAAPATVDPLLPLARQASGGDREALARLLSLIAPSVVTTVRVVLGSQEVDLEDAAQEAMIAIADSIRRFRGESSFLHYARRIAARMAFGLRRARLETARKLAEAVAAPEDDPPCPRSRRRAPSSSASSAWRRSAACWTSCPKDRPRASPIACCSITPCRSSRGRQAFR